MAKKTKRFQALRNLRRAVVLASLLVLVFGLAFSGLAWEAERARQSAYLVSLVEMGERALNAYFGDIEKALTILGEDVRGRDGNVDVRAASVLLKRFKRVYPESRIVIVARPDGQILATSEGAPGAPLPTLGAEPSFIRSREELARGDKLSIGRPFLGPVSGDWVIPIRYGVRDPNGTLRYMLGVGLPVSKPQTFWSSAPLPPGAAMGLVRDDMYVVSRYPVPEGGDLRRIYGSAQSGPLTRHLLREKLPRGGTVEGVSNLTREGALYAYRRLTDYPATLYINNPQSNVWTEWWRDVRVPFLLMLVWLAGGFAIYRWVRRRQQSWEEERDTRLEVAAAAAQMGWWERDLHSGALLWSAEFKRLLGYEPGELKESHEEWLSRLHPDDREASLKRVGDASRARGGRYEAEMRLRHRDGSYRTFLSRAAVPRTEGGRSLLVGAVVDITERKRNEEEVRRLNAELEQRVAERTRELTRASEELIRSEKLAALGSMVAGVAHELNTPIGNSLLAASTLGENTRAFARDVAGGALRRSALDRFLEETREAGEILQRNLHSAADLITGFKRLSADQLSEQRRRFLLREVVDEVLMAMRPTLKRSRFSVSSSVPGDIEMDSYPGPLSQVLINLVQNAATHAFDGRRDGSVTIRAARVDAHRVEIAVADDGVGISSADQKRVFDPFFTTKLGRGGSGLGLTISNNLVTGPLEGKIFLESAPGAGTTVRMLLPLEVH
ncbi:MAG TPA: ATP-binding protein [Burkholderiales bacterium]|nr:ATP-binding protein [Burkholderiales bacterium]